MADFSLLAKNLSNLDPPPVRDYHKVSQVCSIQCSIELKLVDFPKIRKSFKPFICNDWRVIPDGKLVHPTFGL